MFYDPFVQDGNVPTADDLMITVSLLTSLIANGHRVLGEFRQNLRIVHKKGVSGSFLRIRNLLIRMRSQVKNVQSFQCKFRCTQQI